MTFRHDFVAALNSGAGYEALMYLVRRHSHEFSSLQDVYDVLEGIWKELGFDVKEEESSLRDELEVVMEKVWYECPA